MSTTYALTPYQKIGLQASWQTDAMLRVLLSAAHHGNIEELPCLVQALVPRLLQLNSVAMSAHDPDSDTLASLREGLYGGYERMVLGSAAAPAMGSSDSAHGTATSPCTGCRDNFPLPDGPLDFFDTHVVQDYIQRRTACTLRPAAQKPCLPKGGAA